MMTLTTPNGKPTQINVGFTRRYAEHSSLNADFVDLHVLHLDTRTVVNLSVIVFVVISVGIVIIIQFWSLSSY